MRTSILVLGAAAVLTGCAHKQASDSSAEASASAEDPASAEAPASAAGGAQSATASAHLEPKSGNTSLSGHAEFTPTEDGAKLVLHVTGAPPGPHGAHIHETGDCSDPEAKSAGGHWNPEGHSHGAPPPTQAHLGDLGNIDVGEDGTGHLELTSTGWKVGGGSPQDVIGKAIVIHGGPDDLASDPAGNSGPRIGCGVIR